MSVASERARPRALPSGVGSWLALCLALSATAGGCSLTRTSVDDCETNADCRAAFGSGSVCGGDGLCERAPLNPRCTETFPGDLLTRPESYPGAILFGYETLGGLDTQRARANAVRLAATQVGEQGGLDGHPIGVVICDIAEDAKYDSLKRQDAAVASARYLADVLGTSAIIGPSASPDVLAVFRALAGADVLVISPSATSPELTTADVVNPTDERPGLLWRTAPSDVLQGAAVARYLTSVTPPVTNVTIIEEKGAYGDGLTQVFTADFQKDGRAARVLPFAAGVSSERDAAIVDGPTGAPQVVLFFSSLSADGTAFLNAVSALASYASTDLFLTDSAANADVLANAAGAAAVFPRVTGSRPSVPAGPVHDLFRTSYTAAFKEDPEVFTFVPHAYDAAWLVFYGAAFALRHEHAITGTTIARGLRHLSSKDPEIEITPANWKRIADALGAGASVNVTGASGTLDYDLATEETTGLIDIWKISADGKEIQTIKTIDPR